MSRRLKMLMLSPEAPWPATTGGLVRIGALFTQMARLCDVTFVSPRRPGQHVPQQANVRFICPECADSPVLRRARALLDPSRPFHVSAYSRAAIHRVVREELAQRQYDVVFSHFIYHLDYLSHCTVPIVVDQQNVDRVYWGNKAENSPFPVSVFAEWNTRKTIAFETRRLRRIWGYISVSDEDRELTRAYAGRYVKHFWVAPNGVDTHRFTPATPHTPSPSTVTMGYLGSMDLQMNVEAVQRFCATLLPRIRETLPGVDVKFVAIGRAPTRAIQELAAATPGMSLSGTVDDVVPWLQRLDILVCPLKIGAGTKLKVAEAMSCGLPVVGSALAFAGVPGRSGEHFIQAQDDDQFVEAARDLARAPEQRARIGGNARDLARTHLEWEAIGERLAREIQEALVND